MKDSYLINFSLFCLKRNFNLLTYLTKNKDITYEQFSELMRSKSVTPPDFTYFSNIKSKAISINVAKEKEQDIIEKNVIVPTITLKEEIKPKRKRRTRKKAEKWLILIDSEIDFLKLIRHLKEARTRKVEKASKSNLAHNSYVYKNIYESQERKNYYGKKRRNYSDYS